MKTIFTNPKKRKFFQFEIDDEFRKKLDSLGSMDGLKPSGIIRMLVNREYSRRFNGNGQAPLAMDPPGNEDKK